MSHCIVVRSGPSTLNPPILSGKRTAAAFVGEAVTFVNATGATVLRQPDGSDVTFTSTVENEEHLGAHEVSFVPSRPGLYQVRGLRDGRLPFGVDIVVFPTEALTHPHLREPGRRVTTTQTIPDPNPRLESVVREIFQRFVFDRALHHADLTVCDELTSDRPVPMGVDWSQFAPDGR